MSDLVEVEIRADHAVRPGRHQGERRPVPATAFQFLTPIRWGCVRCPASPPADPRKEVIMSNSKDRALRIRSSATGSSESPTRRHGEMRQLLHPSARSCPCRDLGRDGAELRQSPALRLGSGRDRPAPADRAGRHRRDRHLLAGRIPTQDRRSPPGAGKHVLREEPLANSVAQARAVASRRAGSICPRRPVHGPASPTASSSRRARLFGSSPRTIGTVPQRPAQYLPDSIVDPQAPLSWRLQREIAGSGALGGIACAHHRPRPALTISASPAQRRDRSRSSRNSPCWRAAVGPSGTAGRNRPRDRR